MPVLCKVYIGDFVLPSVKFDIEEMEVWKYREDKNEGTLVKDETMKAKNKGSRTPNKMTKRSNSPLQRKNTRKLSMVR